MRLIVKLLLCVCLLPVGAFCQEKVAKIMVGPKDDQTRVVAAFIESSPETFKMQSMIIDLTPLKSNKEVPTSVFIDLTSTVRSLSTGEKKQKILQLRWQKIGEIEFKCDGKWKKQTADPATNKIIEAVNALFQNIPLNTKNATEIELPEDVEQKIMAVLDSLDTENFSCLRNLQ